VRTALRHALLLLLLMGCGPPCRAAAEARAEDAVKAAFIFRFAGYVDWPAESSVGGGFVIGVMGSDGVLAALQLVLRNHPLGGLPAQARRITSAAELADLRILYIGTAGEDRIRAMTAAVGARPILIVTSSDQGLAAGSMINFVPVDRHLRFEVSLAAADRAGLKISSDLLSVAARVQGGRIRSGVSCGAPRNGEPEPAPCQVPAVLADAAGDEGRT
jgi:hypothetical protein